MVKMRGFIPAFIVGWDIFIGCTARNFCLSFTTNFCEHGYTAVSVTSFHCAWPILVVGYRGFASTSVVSLPLRHWVVAIVEPMLVVCLRKGGRSHGVEGVDGCLFCDLGCRWSVFCSTTQSSEKWAYCQFFGAPFCVLNLARQFHFMFDWLTQCWHNMLMYIASWENFAILEIFLRPHVYLCNWIGSHR